MIAPDLKTLNDLGVIQKSTKPFYTDVLEKSSLLLSDYQTIRDLTKIPVQGGSLHLNALLVLMFNNLSHGSLCLSLDLENVNSKLKTITDAITFTEENIKNCLEVLKENKLLITTDFLFRVDPTGIPFIHQETNAGNLLYFQRFYLAEKRVQASLTQLMGESENTNIGGKSLVQIKEALGEVCSSMKAFQLNPLQLLAVCCGLTKNFIVISGGPGTGKTSTATALLRAMVRLGVDPQKIKLTAPTGRAAQRLGESLKDQMGGINLSQEDKALLDAVEGQTLHRLLKYNPRTGGFSYGPENPIDADVVLIDEVSMVDVFMMSNLLSALKPDTRVIFLGDKDQLPSVDEGAVLESLTPAGYEHEFSDELLKLCEDLGKPVSSFLLPPSGKESTPPTRTKDSDPRQNRIIILEESHRSVKDILNFAQSINQGKVGTFTDVLKHQPLIEDTKKWQQYLETWMANQYKGYKKSVNDFKGGPDEKLNETLDKIFRITEASRILTLTRGGLQGKNWINKKLNVWLKSKTDKDGTENVFAGAPMLITTNSPPNNLFNGDTGVILERNGEYRAWFRLTSSFPHSRESDEGIQLQYRSFALKSLPSWEAACAITVHKSQGSEYSNLLLVLPSEQKHRLLSRQIVYTGITRAKSGAIIYGNTDVLQTAIENRMERESGLGGY